MLCVSVACKPLDEDEKGIKNVYTLGKKQRLLCVSESGLYSLIFTSSKRGLARMCGVDNRTWANSAGECFTKELDEWLTKKRVDPGEYFKSRCKVRGAKRSSTPHHERDTIRKVHH